MASNDHISSLYLKSSQISPEVTDNTDNGLKCFICDYIAVESQTEKKSQSLEKHLLTEHNVVIADIESIADLNQYCDHWRPKLTQTQDLSRFCVTINTNCGAKDVFSSETYYMIGGNETEFPEDSKLRRELKERHLQSILKQSEFERNDDSFERNCIFCRKVFAGNRINLFKHLSELHNFNVGNPDNIVNCLELLDVLEHKLSQLQCLYCEKTFTQWTALKEHMRKKSHKLLNPNNREYDKYYLINYLSPGKDWRLIKLEPEYESDNTLDQNEWNDWSEDNQQNQCICLFCEFSAEVKALKQHLIAWHGFDLDSLLSDLDFYLRIKLINYIRRSVHENKCPKCQQTCQSSDELSVHLDFSAHINQIPDQSQYDLPEYYFPTYEDDSLLHFLDGTDIDETDD